MDFCLISINSGVPDVFTSSFYEAEAVVAFLGVKAAHPSRKGRVSKTQGKRKAKLSGAAKNP